MFVDGKAVVNAGKSFNWAPRYHTFMHLVRFEKLILNVENYRKFRRVQT